MKKLLLLPFLLAACAPAISNAPKPAPGEVIVETARTPGSDAGLSPEQIAGVKGLAAITVLLVTQTSYSTGLPSSYSSFSFTDGANSIKRLNTKDKPLEFSADWRAKENDGTGTVDVHWESRPLGDLFLSVRIKAVSSDPKIDTHGIEEALLKRLYQVNNISFISSGR